MARSLLALLLVACTAQKPAPTPPLSELRGIYTADLDRAANPCDDFFKFANGAWRAANPIPASMDRWSRRWKSGEENKEKLRDILKELADGHWPQGSLEQQVGDFYGTCMDEARIDAAGLSPLQPLLKEIDGAKEPQDVQRLIRRLNDLQIPVPFVFYSQPDQHQPTRTFAEISAGGLGLPDRDYYFKPEERFEKARAQYHAHLAATLKLMGRGDDEAQIFALEKRLAEPQLENAALRDPKNTDHVVKFEDLQKMTPHFDWAAYYGEAKLPRGELNVDQPKFMEAVDRELTQTPVAVWRAYLAFHLVESAAPWLSKPFQDEWFKFNQTELAGVGELKPRAVRCAEVTDEQLGEAAGRKYVERYFPPIAKERALELVHNVLAAMKETIEGLTWMGPETKAKALEKLSTFNPKIGYPDKWKDYSSVKIARASFWDNLAAARKFNVDDDRALIGKPTDRGRWGMTPPTSNAYYNPLLNEIVFPAGILQPPGFDPEAEDAVNYGGIGVVIGHEISHGFDDQGAQFDAQGRLSNWWTEADLKAFQQRTQCVVDQFEGYFIEPGVHHNGRLVLGESIGDLAGAKIAWRALQKALQQHPAQPKDGFTPAQQFFIAWGQWRGDETRMEAQRLMIQGDPHPVAKYRVNGPLSNAAEFQKAFACPADSAMVRKMPCEVW
ncbi:MAG TPA: M13 family metallopeptidase [Myxococcales bacterium]|nr:M13 family metallopeptidase [Myxococcales bacterium]